MAKYKKVTEWIRSRVASGELAGGDRLESEHEISSLFGISRQTVRHALDLLEHQGILMRRQGSGTYVKENCLPDPVAREVSRTVTIVSTYVDGYIFPRILRAMVKTLEEAGYSARIMFTNNRIETERHLLLRLLQEDSRDALIVEPVMSGLPNPNLDCYRSILKRNIPVLFFHSYYPELDVPHVCMDDEAAGRMAAEYLISQGHTRIGGIFKLDDGQGQQRYRGYQEALLDAGLPLLEERVSWIDTTDQRNFHAAAPGLCERLRDCTACVCYNDEVAHALTDYVLETGCLKIPEDLSVVSIDNSELARLNAVPLTSVSHPMEALGQKTAEHILRMIKEPGFDADYTFAAELEVRDSVRRISDEGQEETDSAHAAERSKFTA